MMESGINYYISHAPKVEYWQDVKTEIEKI